MKKRPQVDPRGPEPRAEGKARRTLDQAGFANDTTQGRHTLRWLHALACDGPIIAAAAPISFVARSRRLGIRHPGKTFRDAGRRCAAAFKQGPDRWVTRALFFVRQFAVSRNVEAGPNHPGVRRRGIRYVMIRPIRKKQMAWWQRLPVYKLALFLFDGGTKMPNPRRNRAFAAIGRDVYFDENDARIGCRFLQRLIQQMTEIQLNGLNRQRIARFTKPT